MQATVVEHAFAEELSSDDLFEVVDGQRREKPVGALEVYLANVLVQRLSQSAEVRSTGRAVMEILFALRAEPKLQRRPDAALVSFERWSQHHPVPRTNAWEVVPDFAVEIISQTNLADELPTRVREYFEAGVRLLWVIFPSEALAYVYESPTEIRVVDRDGELDLAAIVPGFQMPLASLFRDLSVDQG